MILMNEDARCNVPLVHYFIRIKS